MLAFDLHQHAFDALLSQAMHARDARGRTNGTVAEANVVVQWDPERALGGEGGRAAHTSPIYGVRSLQMGLRGEAARAYGALLCGELVESVQDVTPLFLAISKCLAAGDIKGALMLLPEETPYALPAGCVIGETAGKHDAKLCRTIPPFLTR